MRAALTHACARVCASVNGCHPRRDCRPDYMTTFVDKLINWDVVAKRFEAATS
jgi:hypothetical protein